MSKYLTASTRAEYERMIAEGYDVSKGSTRPIVPDAISVADQLGLWREGTVNLDLGGGKYALGTNYLAERGVVNLILDPGNRPPWHNLEVLDYIEQHGCHTATLANLLNVIPTEEGKAFAVRTAYDALYPGGMMFVCTHAAKERGWNPRSKSWQEGPRPLHTYLPLVSPPFIVYGGRPTRGIIIALKP